jgi:hypothetical protein
MSTSPGGTLEQHGRRLRAVAYRRLGSLSEADDALQDAWLRPSRGDASFAARNSTAHGTRLGGIWYSRARVYLLGEWNWYLPRHLEWLPRLHVAGKPSSKARYRVLRFGRRASLNAKQIRNREAPGTEPV